MSLFRTDGTVDGFVVFESTVQESQFAQLLLLVDIAFVVQDDEHFLNHGGGRIHGPGIVSRHDDVQRFVIARIGLSVAPTPGPLLDTALAPNGDLATRLGFQFLLRFPTRTDNETNEIVIGVLVDGDGNFLHLFGGTKERRQLFAVAVRRTELEQLFQYALTLRRVAFLPSHRPRVLAFAIGTVHWIVDGTRGQNNGGREKKGSKKRKSEKGENVSEMHLYIFF